MSRARIDRTLSREPRSTVPKSASIIAPRRVGSRLVDFSRLELPQDLRLALAEAFWNHADVRSVDTLLGYWHGIHTFTQFVVETQALSALPELTTETLVRYIEWLNGRVRQDGVPWSPATRAQAYYSMRTLLRWLQRSRPHLLSRIVFPVRVYRGKESAKRRLPPLPPQAVRAILRACEAEISQLRSQRERGRAALAAARAKRAASLNSLGGFLLYLERHHGGIAPPALALPSHVRKHSDALGGYRAIEPCLYPRFESLFPYYVAIVIHTGGNPEAIARLPLECLQPVPLLDDRELLIWSKGRTIRLQQRAFRTGAAFEPPTLVRELTEWTRPLRSHAAAIHRQRVFIGKGHLGVAGLSPSLQKKLRAAFIARHHLPQFSLMQLRASVLTAFYRASGDLRQVKEIANHAQLSTTATYVRGPEVEREHRERIATLQSAYLGHLEAARAESLPSGAEDSSQRRSVVPHVAAVPPGTAVSLFGFNCKDPLAGVAPGTHAGELCHHFLGCFTCPNAVITADPISLARLLEARDHLRSSATYLHPARFDAIYAPLLKILDEDILTRFSASELTAATALCRKLPPIPPLR